jgi:hypothetical protein
MMAGQAVNENKNMVLKYLELVRYASYSDKNYSFESPAATIYKATKLTLSNGVTYDEILIYINKTGTLTVQPNQKEENRSRLNTTGYFQYPFFQGTNIIINVLVKGNQTSPTDKGPLYEYLFFETSKQAYLDQLSWIFTLSDEEILERISLYPNEALSSLNNEQAELLEKLNNEKNGENNGVSVFIQTEGRLAIPISKSGIGLTTAINAGILYDGTKIVFYCQPSAGISQGVAVTAGVAVGVFPRANIEGIKNLGINIGALSTVIIVISGEFNMAINDAIFSPEEWSKIKDVVKLGGNVGLPGLAVGAGAVFYAEASYLYVLKEFSLSVSAEDLATEFNRSFSTNFTPTDMLNFVYILHTNFVNYSNP